MEILIVLIGEGNHIEESEYDKEYDITLLIDVLSTLRRFNQK